MDWLKTCGECGAQVINKACKLLTQFQLFMKMAELSRQSVNVNDGVTKILAGDCQRTCTVEQNFAVQSVEICDKSRIAGSNVHEVLVETERDAEDEDEPPRPFDTNAEWSSGGLWQRIMDARRRA